ncbi:MAG: hypothetical protein AAGI66_06990 [Cyanobacteria bacterium P01_H01_bin.74]
MIKSLQLLAKNPTVSTFLMSVMPKSVGSLWRIHDDRKAPKAVKNATWKRELLTLVQVGLYALVSRKLADKFFSQKNKDFQYLSVIGISCASNFLAEFTSRKFAPRDIWGKKSPNNPVSFSSDNTATSKNGEFMALTQDNPPTAGKFEVMSYAPEPPSIAFTGMPPVGNATQFMPSAVRPVAMQPLPQTLPLPRSNIQHRYTASLPNPFTQTMPR